MPLEPTPLKKPAVHFIGIGGIGMSALARWFLAHSTAPKSRLITNLFLSPWHRSEPILSDKVEGLAQNWAIFGSDIAGSEITQALKEEGVIVRIGHQKHLSPHLNLIIYSQAIKPNNPELVSTKKLGIKTLSYPEAVGELSREYLTIAVAGAHGKSTTTALAALILRKAKLDPTVIVGTNLKEFGNKNFRSGNGPYLIIEADEYNRAFLNYSPTMTIITNIDKEHLDFYKNLADIKKTFLKFISQTKNGGVLVLNRDDLNLHSLRKQIRKIAKSKKLHTHWYSLFSNSRELDNIKKVIKIAGEHNVSNSLAALTLSKVLKIKERTALKAISDYRGAWRRMEFKGTCRMAHVKCRVYDDYAHHPTEIKATLTAFKEKFPKSFLICVFQPHQAERLARLFREFQTAFDAADALILLPTYQVAGRDKTSSKYSSEKLANIIRKQNPKKSVLYLKDPKKIKEIVSKLFLNSSAEGGSASGGKFYILHSPVLVMMGAGDIFKYTEKLIKK